MLSAYKAGMRSKKREGIITLDNAVFRLWFSAGSIGPVLSLIHVNEAESELSKRLKDPSTKLVARNLPLLVSSSSSSPAAPTDESGSEETKQATAKIEVSTASPAESPPAGMTNPTTQASSGKNGKKGKKGKSIATAQPATKQDPMQAPAPAPLVDKPPSQPEPAPVPPKGPGCQIAVEVFEGADTIILRYIPFEHDMRAVAMTNDFDELTEYSIDKGEIRVGPVWGLVPEEQRPIPGHDVVHCIYQQFYVWGEDPWAFHLRDGDGGGRKGIHILDFIDGYIKTTLKKEAEDYELETLMKNLK